MNGLPDIAWIRRPDVVVLGPAPLLSQCLDLGYWRLISHVLNLSQEKFSDDALFDCHNRKCVLELVRLITSERANPLYATRTDSLLCSAAHRGHVMVVECVLELHPAIHSGPACFAACMRDQVDICGHFSFAAFTCAFR